MRRKIACGVSKNRDQDVKKTSKLVIKLIIYNKPEQYMKPTITGMVLSEGADNRANVQARECFPEEDEVGRRGARAISRVEDKAQFAG